MKEIKPETYTQNKKLICDWSDEKNYLIHHRVLKYFVRHGMIVQKVCERISYEQSKWLEIFIRFNTQKRKRAKSIIEKDFYNLLNNANFGKMTEKVPNRLLIDFKKKNFEYDNNIKQQYKLTFNGVHKSYENCDIVIHSSNTMLLWTNRFMLVLLY